MMNLEHYNRSYEKFIESLDEEIDLKLREIRQQCVRDFINRLNRRRDEWETTFQELLNKSQEDNSNLLKESSKNSNNQLQTKSVQFATPIATEAGKSSNFDATLDSSTLDLSKTTDELSLAPAPNISDKDSHNEKLLDIQKAKSDSIPIRTLETTISKETVKQIDALTNQKSIENDPLFTNSGPIKEFVRIQELLEQNRKLLHDLTTETTLKPFRNELNLFIRTQINSISNSDSQHLNSKTKLLTSLFTGDSVSFQDKLVIATKHPQGQLFSMDLAAQTFVTVGIRLVNSVPAIAKSMATVINGIIIDKNIAIFRDLITGHLQEQCPYLIPMNPDERDFSNEPNPEVKFKIACGYNYDSKSQTLESDEKYLIRMRSMTLMYACILTQGHIQLAWTWLASFLSLKPQPIITATILQAFLQEASKSLSSTYGRQYRKILDFIKDHYIKMIEDVTPKPVDRQSLIKLKNLMADDTNLIAGPSMGSIFGVVKYGM